MYQVYKHNNEQGLWISTLAVQLHPPSTLMVPLLKFLKNSVNLPLAAHAANSLSHAYSGFDYHVKMNGYVPVPKDNVVQERVYHGLRIYCIFMISFMVKKKREMRKEKKTEKYQRKMKKMHTLGRHYRASLILICYCDKIACSVDQAAS